MQDFLTHSLTHITIELGA